MQEELLEGEPLARRLGIHGPLGKVHRGEGIRDARQPRGAPEARPGSDSIA